MTLAQGPVRPDGTPIDKEAIRRKYLEERDKRLRPDGNDQYRRLTGSLAHYLTDPYTPRAEREPRTTTSPSPSSAAASPAWSPAPA
jgi:cyclohexanone monooxygenase